MVPAHAGDPSLNWFRLVQLLLHLEKGEVVRGRVGQLCDASFAIRGHEDPVRRIRRACRPSLTPSVHERHVVTMKLLMLELAFSEVDKEGAVVEQRDPPVTSVGGDELFLWLLLVRLLEASKWHVDSFRGAALVLHEDESSPSLANMTKRSHDSVHRGNSR